MTASPSLRFRDNLDEVNRLLGIHKQLTGVGPGRRHNVDVLNRSAILFACASFEAFVEDLASSGFDQIVSRATNSSDLPLLIRKSIATQVREDKNELKAWSLAGDGWKVVAAEHKAALLRKYVGPFNTPKFGNISNLLKELLGFDSLDECFKWRGMTIQRAKTRLSDFVALRGALAHGEKPAPTVTKKAVLGYISFLAPLSVRMSNNIREYCHARTAHYPWPKVMFGKIT